MNMVKPVVGAAEQEFDKEKEPGKIVIALGKDPANLKLKYDLDIIMLKNPEFLKKYNKNRSLLLMDVIRDLVKKNRQYL